MTTMGEEKKTDTPTLAPPPGQAEDVYSASTVVARAPEEILELLSRSADAKAASTVVTQTPAEILELIKANAARPAGNGASAQVPPPPPVPSVEPSAPEVDDADWGLEEDGAESVEAWTSAGVVPPPPPDPPPIRTAPLPPAMAPSPGPVPALRAVSAPESSSVTLGMPPEAGSQHLDTSRLDESVLSSPTPSSGVSSQGVPGTTSDLPTAAPTSMYAPFSEAPTPRRAPGLAIGLAVVGVLLLLALGGVALVLLR